MGTPCPDRYLHRMATRVLDNVWEALAITPIVAAALTCAWLLADGYQPAPAESPSAGTEPPSVSTAEAPEQAPARGPASPAVAVVLITTSDEQAERVNELLAAETELRMLVGESPRLLDVVVLEHASNSERVASALQAGWGAELQTIAAQLSARGINVSAPPYEADIVR